MNNSTISGNLGSDPEVRYFESGTCKTTFSVAVYGGKDKRSGDVITHWIGCEAWGETAELAAQNLKKGDRVLCTGDSKIEQWEKDGVKQTAYRLNVREFGIIPRKQKSDRQSRIGDDRPEDYDDVAF